MGEKQFPEIVSAAGMAAMTEHQGLELRCSATNYMRKIKLKNPYGVVPTPLVRAGCDD
jgi:hypothetical protein